jgi:hypothetical protein
MQGKKWKKRDSTFCTKTKLIIDRYHNERLYKCSWIGKNGKTYTDWGKTKSPTPEEREAAEMAVMKIEAANTPPAYSAAAAERRS